MRTLPVVAAASAVGGSRLLASGRIRRLPAPASPPPRRVLDLGGVVGPGGICQSTHPTRRYTLDMTFPIDYPDQQALTDYVNADPRRLRERRQDARLAESAVSSSTRRAPAITPAAPPRSTQSVVFKVYQNVGGAHPKTFYQAFNWDVVKHAPITFDSLFKDGTAPLDVIFPAVKPRPAEAAGDDRRRSRPATGSIRRSTRTSRSPTTR